MLSPEIVQQIHCLLAEDRLSQRKIAELVGVSRTTVHIIAAGKRPDYENRSLDEEPEAEPPCGPPQRCHGCGGFVLPPCRLCRVRAHLADNRGIAGTRERLGAGSGPARSCDRRT